MNKELFDVYDTLFKRIFRGTKIFKVDNFKLKSVNKDGHVYNIGILRKQNFKYYKLICGRKPCTVSIISCQKVITGEEYASATTVKFLFLDLLNVVLKDIDNEICLLFNNIGSPLLIILVLRCQKILNSLIVIFVVALSEEPLAPARAYVQRDVDNLRLSQKKIFLNFYLKMIKIIFIVDFLTNFFKLSQFWQLLRSSQKINKISLKGLK